MTTCERCGRLMPENIAICPSCGTITSFPRSATGDYRENSGPQPSPEYAQGYPPPAGQAGYVPPQQMGYAPPQQMGYAPQGQVYGQPPVYTPLSVNINVGAPPVAAPTNTASLVIEIILNCLGIYGVGWIAAGETTVGIVLLICTFLFYWPILIVGTILTFGLGLCGLIPLSVIAIIVNALLLNKAIKNRAAYSIQIRSSR